MAHQHHHPRPHGPGHSHLPANVSSRTMGAAVALTIAFVIVEALSGWWGHSLALLSDAGHNLADAAALGFSWYALWIAGMNANAWPDTPRPNPFLPGSARRAAGLPHSSPERELAYTRRVTERLLASAPEVMCSFIRYSGEEALRVSPLIEMLPEVPDAAPTPRNIAHRIFSAGVWLDQQPYRPAPPVVPGSVQMAASVSSLALETPSDLATIRPWPS